MISKSLTSILALIMLLGTNPARAQLDQTAIPQSNAQIQLSFAPVVKQVAPAIVNIYTKRKVQVRSVNPFMNDPFFSRFFGGNMFAAPMKERVENSLGSGVIIKENGTIITNAHVIKGAQEITVALSDGREFEATLALQDDASDLAVLTLSSPPDNLPTAQLKPSETLQVGDLVLAIGNPFGVGQTVTSGIVSAQGRSSLNINDFNFFIQTDAAINPGNSGGALVTLDGKIVGINSAIYSRDGGSLGIGFAIPSEMVATIIAAQENGQTGTAGITRPWLGVTAQNMTSDIAQSMALETPQGVLINKLHKLSPLKKAGLEEGDIVLRVNGKPIRNAAEMKFRTSTVAIGQKSKLTILQGGKEKTITMTAIAPPNDPPAQETTLTGSHPFSGATIANLNPAIGVKLGLTAQSGVTITNIRARTTAARFLKVGAIIKSLNGAEVETVKDLETALKQSSNQGWNIVINYKGQTQTLMLR